MNNELRRIRDYFGEHDKTPFEHWAYNYLNQLLAAKKEDIQPVLRWVKAEERLPDERPGFSHSADVNILLRNVKDETGSLFVSTGSYRYLGVKKWCEYLYGDRLEKGDFKVVAWQPLPSPELSPSKEQQKQSLVEIMEADQRDGMYGVSVGASVNPIWHNGKYRRLASELFSMAADEFSNHGCNDLDPKLLEGWTEPERLQLAIDFENYNVGHLGEFDPNHIFFQDYALMGFFAHLLNSEQGVQVSDTTEADSSTSPDPQNAQKEPVIDNLRDKFFKDMVTKDGIRINSKTESEFIEFDAIYFEPNEVFEWFKPYLKSNLEPVIDWEGLKWAWLSEHAKGTFATDDPIEEFNWLKSNLSKYVK